ncbi:MAG: metallophosphoesterase [Clostridia bacterium]|nr:metallophosphoesterase [Clostridia bacterium]
MKILAVSDEECTALWDYYEPGRLDDYDLIISCGDLKASYLSFLVTMAHCPVLYVPGNHDEGYVNNPPEGCVSIDGQVALYRGYRIVGLGGCMRYRPGPTYMYTERQMKRRIGRLRWALFRSGGFDILVTHAPAKDLGDQEDRPHRGYACFLPLLDKYKPGWFLHGHVHLRNAPGYPRQRQYKDTTVINAWERCTIEVPDRPYTEKYPHQVRWYTRRKREKDFDPFNI